MVVDATAALAEAQVYRDKIRQGAYWASSPEFDYAVRRVYELEEAAEAALTRLCNQVATG